MFIVAPTKVDGLDESIVLNWAMELAARHRSLAVAEWVMHKFGIMTFGIERVDFEQGSRSMRYVNRGDTYDQTVRKDRDGYTVGSWGDWLESVESEYDDDNDTVQCAYCSHHTPLCDKAQREPQGARHSWRETICENCGHNVDGSR